MTERLYYTDSYLREFTARDRRTRPATASPFTSTAPPSIPPPAGSRSTPAPSPACRVRGRRGRGASASPTAWPRRCRQPGPVDCAIDWPRRFDHMQQHTGQHLLSAVFEELFAPEDRQLPPGRGKLHHRSGRRRGGRAHRAGSRAARQPGGLRESAGHGALRRRRRGARTAQAVGRARAPCALSPSRASTAALAAARTCAPPAKSARSCCARLEKIRQSTRVEFLCGGRAVRRARADYEALAKTAQLFSAPLDDVPPLVAAQLEAARTAEKARRKLELDLAAYQGRELYDATPPGPDGFRRVRRRLETRQPGGTARHRAELHRAEKAVFMAALSQPPSVLLAVSADAGMDAGKTLKAALAEAGGRGGGTCPHGAGQRGRRRTPGAGARKAGVRPSTSAPSCARPRPGAVSRSLPRMFLALVERSLP